MKRFFGTAFLIIGLLLDTSGKSRTKEEALQIASTFYATHFHQQAAQPAAKMLRLNHQRLAMARSGDSISCFYIFNRGEASGFVIVSADDRAVPILGYADEGHFDEAAIPENMKGWLAGYENELKSLVVEKPNSAINISITNASVANNATNALAPAVPPLLGGIKWNQRSPYNDLCPVIDSTTNERAVSGCVATGMAQVMKYHQWPAKGIGSNSYTTATNKIPLTVDFSKTTFDWENMTDTYSPASSAIQNDAVAALIYNCGVAVNMDYGKTSNAYTRTMALALKNNFGYDANLQYYSRNYYTRAEWKTLLKTELNAARPVLYRGNSNEGGHLFVCDGYDSNDLFHFNWGWGGVSNGYFQLSALDPNEQGTSGSTDGYNGYQEIVTGLQKPTTSSVASYLLHLNDTISYSAATGARNRSFTLTANKLYNYGINTFTGSIGIALYNASGFVQLLSSSSTINLLQYYGWNAYTTPALTIPASTISGYYKLYVVYRPNADTTWQIVRGLVGTPNYVDVKVTSTSVKLSTPTTGYPTLQLNSFSSTGSLYQNKTGRFNVSLTNKGAEYNSKLLIYLKSTTVDSISQFISIDNVNIATGETRSLNLKGQISVPAGSYYVWLMYAPSNNNMAYNFTSFGGYKLFEVKDEPTGAPNLVLKSAITFPDADNVERSSATLSATIQNTSGYFDNKLVAFIFPYNGGQSLAYIGYQDAIFDTNETKVVTFTGSIDLDLNRYMTILYSFDAATNSWNRIAPDSYSLLNFTLVDNLTSSLNPQADRGLVLYPNPVENLLTVTSASDIHSLAIYDLLGKQIVSMKPTKSTTINIPTSRLTSGTYILNVQTEKGIMVRKFIKK